MKNIFPKILYIFLIAFIAAPWSIVLAATGTINSTNKYAWSNNMGWVNFGAVNGNVQITDSAITGHIWNESYGWINMSPVNGGVTNTTSGALGGYAWGEQVGWINFSGASIDCNGKFTGTATGDVAGTLTFNCTNCNVTTDWLPSQGCDGGGGTGGGEEEEEECDPHGDINKDGSINVVDFSILMYFWQQTNPSNKCADINKDGIVNLIDFSIMLYWWTG